MAYSHRDYDSSKLETGWDGSNEGPQDPTWLGVHETVASIQVSAKYRPTVALT